ncbi:MAG: hypothetical protein ABIT04_09105 [Novosphingobium sp.]
MFRNVHLMQEAVAVIGGVRFLGTSLWTDSALYGHPAAAMHYARNGMNDHRLIYRDGEGESLSPELALTWHESSLAWLKASLQVPFAGKTVVTHHLPHPGSIHPRFVDDALTPAFCSDLSELVESSGAVLWVHGHSHESCDYVAGGNPGGVQSEGLWADPAWRPVREHEL